MKYLKIPVVLGSMLLQSCSSIPDPSKQIPEHLLKFPRSSFAYPVGTADYVTETNDWWDDWHNAQDFGENRHLGEDWNKKSGGDTDCGEPVFATADGRIVFAGNAGPGWGNIVVLEHVATDGTKLNSLYGHLQTIAKTEGVVSRREQIGTIGNADGRYICHLHFELRSSDCPIGISAGAGYSDERFGWIDPSEFIDKTRYR
jgi:murein DD-endopeptidase MepM/ murein hydrolase activator NlpD